MMKQRSMAGGTRKGFKFVTGSRPVITETLDYEEVEQETTTTPGAIRSGKKGGVAKKRSRDYHEDDDDDNQDDVVANKMKKSSALSSSYANRGAIGAKITTAVAASSSSSSRGQKGATSEEKNKAHYPDIPFVYANSNSKSSKSHYDILSALMVQVCKAERIGLEQFFKSNPGTGRDAILSALKQVLSELPEEVASKCPSDSHFDPEFMTRERGEVDMLTSVLNTLKDQSERLARYEQSIADLGKDYGIWLTSEQVQKGSGSSSSNKRSKGSAESAEAKAAMYETLLQGMEEQCSTILRDVNSVSGAIDEATTVQDRLYTKYNKVRVETATTMPAATSAKDIMRNLQSIK